MKKVIAIFLAAILIFSLAACGGTSGDTNSKTETSTSETKTGDTSSANNTSTDGKTLIVYFSWSNNTEKMANYIHDKIGGDIERIEPVEAYPEDYNETTIFIGYPIWWYELPMIMRTFFDTYDLSGKTIIPFNTHEGSGDGGTYDQIKTEEPNAKVLEGLPIRGGDIENTDSKDKVTEWLTGLGY